MASRHERLDSLRVVLEPAVQCLLAFCALDVHLLVDFGGEARHEWLKQGCKELQCLDGGMHDLLAAGQVLLGACLR